VCNYITTDENKYTEYPTSHIAMRNASQSSVAIQRGMECPPELMVFMLKLRAIAMIEGTTVAFGLEKMIWTGRGRGLRGARDGRNSEVVVLAN
jgi:hypothetical protein